MSFADFFGLRHPAPDRVHKRLAGPARSSSRSPEASRDLIASNSSPVVLKLLHCGRARVYRGMEGNWLSRLKEYGDKTGRAVKYTQLSSMGPSDSPTFSYRVELLGRDKDAGRASGGGQRSKRVSPKLRRLGLCWLTCRQPSRPGNPRDLSREIVPQAQTLAITWERACQKRKWPLPCYVEQEFVDGSVLVPLYRGHGFAEHSVDVCIRRRGTGNSKKVAKAAAAKNVLSFANKLLDD
ncbi:hypothetical protein Q5P01_000942 [Channa striata]|uniref:DRBM domain-containing protein n=1 Tax=Channa striata TaxID=64152 RepID=A0AA88IR77_CHASR|nr:hypothetical protein Q5P01_000942 [Channa striata]